MERRDARKEKMDTCVKSQVDKQTNQSLISHAESNGRKTEAKERRPGRGSGSCMKRSRQEG